MLDMSQQISIFIVVCVVILSVSCEDCERDKSRTVRKVIHQELVPIYKDLGVKVPYECPFFKERDRYLDNEGHKERESLNRWSCNYCGKAFIGEIYLDAHFDNRHSDTIYKETDSVCLADFCEIFRCDVISGAAAATFWDVALCMEEDMQDLTQDCQELLEACIPEKLSWNVTNKLRSSLTDAVCSYLSCKKYWDTPDVPGEKEASVAYTVFTVFLIVGMTIYYCVAVNYFLTDTFADMYDSDEIIARNPESLTTIEKHNNPVKKLKHKTRQKTFLDGEKFLLPDRFKSKNSRHGDSHSDSSTRQRLENNRDRYSKRRHLETNEDMFNIRNSRDLPGDMNSVINEIGHSESNEIGHWESNGIGQLEHPEKRYSESISIDNLSDVQLVESADHTNVLHGHEHFDINVTEMEYR